MLATLFSVVLRATAPPSSSPPQAAAAGFNKLVFDDEFDSDQVSPNGNGSYKWYRTNFFSSSATLTQYDYLVANGMLMLLSDESGYSEGLATADAANTSQVYQHGYFEARILMNPSGYITYGWPAFWSSSIERALGQVPVNGTFGELDFAECIPSGYLCTYNTTVHQWQKESSGDVSLAQNANSVPAIPSNTNLSDWHVYGCLWTPTQIQWYFDNTLVTTTPIGPGTPFTALAQDHMYVVLGTGQYWPMFVDYVHIWQ
jgi:hypothetical protein